MTLVYSKCKIHRNEICDFLCKNCKISVCSFCMVSNQHKGHDFFELSEVYKTNVKMAKNEKDELEKNHHTLENDIFDLENQIAHVDATYEKLKKEMLEQKNKWHREINYVINKMKKEISAIKSTHFKILRTHFDDIKHTQSLIEQTLERLKTLEDSTEVSRTIEYKFRNNDDIKVPPLAQVSMTTFIAKPIDSDRLHSLIGKIVPLSIAICGNTMSPEIPNCSDERLPDEFEIVAKLKTKHERSNHVSYVDQGKIWTSGETGNIYFYAMDGLLLHTIKTKSGKTTKVLAIDSYGDLVYSDGIAKTVNKVTNERTKELIKLQGCVPSSLCDTYSGDKLIAMFSDDKIQPRVVRYSGFTEKRMMQFNDKDIPLYTEKTKLYTSLQTETETSV